MSRPRGGGRTASRPEPSGCASRARPGRIAAEQRRADAGDQSPAPGRGHDLVTRRRYPMQVDRTPAEIEDERGEACSREWSTRRAQPPPTRAPRPARPAGTQLSRARPAGRRVGPREKGERDGTTESQTPREGRVVRCRRQRAPDDVEEPVPVSGRAADRGRSRPGGGGGARSSKTMSPPGPRAGGSVPRRLRLRVAKRAAAARRCPPAGPQPPVRRAVPPCASAGVRASSTAIRSGSERCSTEAPGSALPRRRPARPSAARRRRRPRRRSVSSRSKRFADQDGVVAAARSRRRSASLATSRPERSGGHVEVVSSTTAMRARLRAVGQPLELDELSGRDARGRTASSSRVGRSPCARARAPRAVRARRGRSRPE